MKPNKYVAFLRGINVGGKNIIKMASLKVAFEKCGFRNVITFIQSGNVIFETEEKVSEKIINTIENTLSKTFNYQSKIVLASYEQMKKVICNVPIEWKNDKNIRCYVAFIKEPVTEKDVLAEIKLNKGVDSVKTGSGVIYMTTLLSGITKSGYSKLIGTKVYKDITIRNYNTVQRIFDLME
jgi:uncharacterized protein (DUF1697 family)